MRLYLLLLTSGIITGLCEGGRFDFLTFPVKEVEECFQKRAEVAFDTFCFGDDCAASRTIDIIVPCLKLGYDLLYENSTYDLKGDRDVYETAYCAIDACAEGIRSSQGSGVFRFFQDCLNGVKSCVKQPKDEL